MTRKSKREIKRKVEELEPDPMDGRPVLDTLCELLGYDWEVVDDEKNLWRRQETGRVWYVDPGFEQTIEKVLLNHDEE